VSEETPFAKIVFPWRKAITDDRSLTANAKLVALTLSTRMDVHGVCFPGVELVSLEAGRHPRTVQKGLRELERKGYLHIDEGGGRENPNTYTALLPAQTVTPEKGGISPPVALSPETPAHVPETPALFHEKGGDMPPEVDSEVDSESVHERGGASAAARAIDASNRWRPVKAETCVSCSGFGMVDGDLLCAECAEERAA
jgi:Helix-turn-helix domain